MKPYRYNRTSIRRRDVWQVGECSTGINKCHQGDIRSAEERIGRIKSAVVRGDSAGVCLSHQLLSSDVESLEIDVPSTSTGKPVSELGVASELSSHRGMIMTNEDIRGALV